MKTIKTALIVCICLVAAGFPAAGNNDSSGSIIASSAKKEEAPINAGTLARHLKVRDKSESSDSDLSHSTEQNIRNLDSIINDFRNLHDSVGDWLGTHFFAIVILFCGILLSYILSAVLRWLFDFFIMRHLAGKTENRVDDLVVEAIKKPLRSALFTFGVFISAMPLMLSLPHTFFNVLVRLFMAGIAFCVAWGLYRMIDVIDHFLDKAAACSDTALDDLIVHLIRKTLKVTLVVIAVLLIGQNILGINITTLLAGAGVLGLAVAFAARDTIANFFGSIMLVLDKNFSVGDRIKANDVDGVVEKVGFRSTRLRTLDGHLVSVPNSILANTSIENVQKRPYIKFIFDLTVVYDTPAAKVERAIELLHEILDAHEGSSEDRPPRIAFNSFNDWALNINVIVWYHPGDWGMARAWLSNTNLEILRRFNAEGIEFAFPTNTTYLAGDSQRKLEIKTT